MKRFALLSLSACLLTIIASGCCHYCPWGAGFGGACGPGGCGVGTPGVYPSGAVYNSYDSIQATLPGTTIGPITASPTLQPSRYQRTVQKPGDSLPTY